MQRARFTNAILLFLVLGPGAVLSQGGDAPQEPSGIFFERADVNVVNVEVYVTDKKGNLVSGLTRDDFEILENGEPMEITNFYAVAGGLPADGVEAPSELSEISPEDFARQRLEPVAVPDDQRLYLIIYVDNFHLRPADRNRVLRRLHRFLVNELDREDYVMVVSHDRSLKIRVPFTTDRVVVAEALEAIQGLSGIAVLRDAERRKAFEEIESSSSAFEALQHARFFAESTFTETSLTLRHLSDHVSALSGLVGRKAVLHVSDGLPLRPGEDTFLYVDDRFGENNGRVEAYNYDLTVRFREIVSKANAGGVTFYTLDAGGLRAHDSISAEYGGTRQGGGTAFIDAVRSANLQAPLHILADDTGGKSIVNTNAVEANLSRVAADFDNYYSLGYQTPHHGDGRYYKIKVKVRGKGLSVRHRTGYRDKTVEARLTDGSVASLLFGFESNPLGAEIVFGSTQAREGGHFLLPMSLRLPLGQLTLAPVEEAWIGRVKVSVIVRDEGGNVSPIRQQEPLNIRIPAADIERARQQYFTYDLTLAVRKGVVDVAVGLHDEIGSEMCFLRQQARVPGS